MPRINLIPWREAERKRKRQEFGVGILGAFIAAAVITFLVNLQMNAAIDNQNEKNQYLNDEIAKLDKQITEILALEDEKRRLRARIDVIEKLELSRPEIVHMFDQLVRTIPDGVNLTTLKQSDRKLTLKGLAQSSTRVASYMRNIDASEWLKDPALDILETKGSSDGSSEFTLNAAQENPQLASQPDQQVAQTPKGPKGARR
ncbi:MAG TPA: PilN domain-containing protein [Steroidobacteraceae bacterium]|nr:PilN domain-containing protein [Steroidobacteraceae bacterium]